MDLTRFEQAARRRFDLWEQAGITAGFQPPDPEHFNRSKWAAMVHLESGTALGELIVWTSGEADLTVGYLRDGAYRVETYELADSVELESCLTRLTELMLTRPTDSDLHLSPDSN